MSIENAENSGTLTYSSRENGIRSVSYFSLDLTFSDIPNPTPCSYCAAPTQKEFLEFETSTASLTARAAPTPGYGCTGCGLKHFDPCVLADLLERAAGEVCAVGDVTDAERLLRESSVIRQSAAATKTPEFPPRI